MPVEKLDVVVEVLVEIAPADEGPADRSQCVDGKGEREEDDGSEPSAGQRLQPRERLSCA